MIRFLGIFRKNKYKLHLDTSIIQEFKLVVKTKRSYAQKSMQGLLFLFCGEVFEAETVIVAAGYESRYITRTVGIDIPMTRYFEEALVTEMQSHMFDIMLGTADAFHFSLMLRS